MKENLITRKRLLIVAAVIAVITGIVLIGIYFYPKLKLKADTFPLEAGEALSEDVKVYADMTWKKDEKKASMDFSKVDPEKIGSYEAAVVLSGKRYPFTVEVADTKAPEGTLKEETATVAKGTEVKAADLLSEVTDVTKVNVMFAEGDSLSETKTYEETGEFTENLKLTDEAGNSSELVQKIKVILPDETAPVIKGAKSLTITIGITPDYLDGVTAEDETDGDVTKEIKVDSSKVDVKKAGTYEVTYRVKDQAGNEAVKEIKVTVKKAAEKLPKVQQSSKTQQTGSAGAADQNTGSAGTVPQQPSQPQPESQSGSAGSGNSQPTPTPEPQPTPQPEPAPQPESTPQPEPTPDQGSGNSGGNDAPPDWVDPSGHKPLTPEEYDEMVNNCPF